MIYFWFLSLRVRHDPRPTPLQPVRRERRFSRFSRCHTSLCFAPARQQPHTPHRRHLQTHMLALMLPAAMADFPACMPSMTCIKLTPYKDRDLVFDCATLNSSTPSNKSIYFMHGNDGPRRSSGKRNVCSDDGELCGAWQRRSETIAETMPNLKIDFTYETKESVSSRDRLCQH